MFDDVLAANRDYVAAGFPLAGIPARAAKGFGLVTCMDTRLEPLSVLGLHPGDAKIMRNAGGRVTVDVLRSLALATTYLGVTEVAVMQHTRCALAGVGDDELKAGFAPDQLASADGWEFRGMPDPDAALADDVETVRSCKILAPGVRVEGWRYDVDTGLVARVISG